MKAKNTTMKLLSSNKPFDTKICHFSWVLNKIGPSIIFALSNPTQPVKVR